MARLLKDNGINAVYDLWMEFELFGIPYAANEQVATCRAMGSPLILTFIGDNGATTAYPLLP